MTFFEQALDVIEGFNLIQERSQGVFSYSIKGSHALYYRYRPELGSGLTAIEKAMSKSIQMARFNWATTIMSNKIRIMQGGKEVVRRKSHS